MFTGRMIPSFLSDTRVGRDASYRVLFCQGYCFVLASMFSLFYGLDRRGTRGRDVSRSFFIFLHLAKNVQSSPSLASSCSLTAFYYLRFSGSIDRPPIICRVFFLLYRSIIFPSDYRKIRRVNIIRMRSVISVHIFIHLNRCSFHALSD